MNITEFMSFDLEWFTTLPGLLITGGVIVLLVALIFFIISNKKTDKKEKEEVVEQQPIESQDIVQSVNASLPIDSQVMGMPVNTVAPVEPQMQINEMAATINVPVVPEVTNVSNNTASNEPVDVTYNSNGSVNILGTPQVNGTAPKVSTAVEIPTFFEQNIPANNVTATNTNGSVANNPIDFSINGENATPIVNAPSAVPPVAVEPIIPQTYTQTAVSMPEVAQVEVQTQVTATPVVEPVSQPTIYGGVSPINTVNTTPVVEEAKPVIYGGANPLENTTTLPIMNNHGAYNASGNNAYSQPVQSVQNITPPVAEVTQPVVEQPQTVVTPEVNQAPVEPVVMTQMPMTAAEMFGTNDTYDNSGSNNSLNEIETLEF